jgi:hypothetical protein
MTANISDKEVKAFLFLSTKGRDDEALAYVGKLPHVTVAKKLYGVYDVSAEVTAPNMGTLQSTIKNIQRQGYDVQTQIVAV